MTMMIMMMNNENNAESNQSQPSAGHTIIHTHTPTHTFNRKLKLDFIRYMYLH